MELKTLSVILFVTAWEVTSLHVEGPPLTTYRPCLGRLYFDKLLNNNWKCNIDLVKYTDRDDITIELRFLHDIRLMPSSNSKIEFSSYEMSYNNTVTTLISAKIVNLNLDSNQPYTVQVKRPIPPKIEFDFKLFDAYADPVVLKFAVDNVTLCNEAVRQVLSVRYADNNVDEGHCGKKVFSKQTMTILKTDAQSGDWPWHVAVIANKTKLCGGTIVSRTAVVTVDYCVQNVQTNQVEVIAGTTTPLAQLGHLDKIKTQVYQAREILISSEDKGSVNYKLAIIKIDGFVFTKMVKPICLYNAEQSNLFGNEAIIVGFGGQTRTDFKLKTISTVLLEEPDCKQLNIEDLNNVTFCGELGPTSSSYADNGNAGSALVVSTVAFDDRITWFLRGVDYTCLPIKGYLALQSMCEMRKHKKFLDIALDYNWIKSHAGL